jgi:hypothetical protein
MNVLSSKARDPSPREDIKEVSPVKPVEDAHEDPVEEVKHAEVSPKQEEPHASFD